MTSEIFTGGTTLEELRDMANASHRACESSARSLVIHARDCGQTLLAVKARLRHGDFTPWVREHCEFSERQAQRYMRIAANWDKLVHKELGDDVNPKTTRAADLSIEGLTIREAERILGGAGESDDDGPAARDVFDARTCPSCGQHLAEIKPYVCTCVHCDQCKLYPPSGRGGKSKGNPRYAYLDAADAWQRMTTLDRAKFRALVCGEPDPCYVGDCADSDSPSLHLR
jgi:DUF3102 family protein